MKIHDHDICDQIEPIEFGSASEAIEHIIDCGYWSAPIYLPDPVMDYRFYSHYIASDWSTDGHIHYQLRS